MRWGSEEGVLVLRTGQRDLPLGTEDIAIEIANPLTSAGGHVEITDGGLDLGGHAVPVELWIALDDVGGRFITQLTVHARLLELVIERIGFLDVIGVAELSDKIGGAQQRGLRFLPNAGITRRKSGALDGTREPLLVE